MAQPKPPCERCGAPAIVHITSEGIQGGGVRHLCLDCADAETPLVRRGERRLNHAAVLIAVGTMILLLSVFADVLKFGHSPGFGYKQWIGLVLAGGGILVGAVTRISTLLVIGVLTGGLTLLADYIGFGKGAGFGLEQMAGTFFGLVVMVAGVILAKRERRGLGLARPG